MSAETKKSAVSYIAFFVFGIVLIVLDQITKVIALRTLPDNTISIIDGVFELRYLENRGAAFGILQNNIPVFLIFTIIILAVIIYCLVNMRPGKKYRPMYFCMGLLFAGAIGNMIDRIFRHYVVDFLYARFIDFPIFNVADIYVTIGAILIVLLIIFKYKDGDFDTLVPKSMRKKKTEEK